MTIRLVGPHEIRALFGSFISLIVKIRVSLTLCMLVNFACFLL